ncbi:MAG: peptide-methionine (S)-S-oxide reductase MsrA [Rhodospirillales bacterium]
MLHLPYRRHLTYFLLAIAVGLAAWRMAGAEGQSVTLPDPVVDASPASAITPQVAVIAGGCFWGIQGVYQHVNGVISATSGYAGGTAATADYHTVSSGSTGHAESVKIVFDPAKVSYGQLLKVFFSVAHDPTQLNRQGPDTGTQYRSAIFYTDDEQKRIAEAYVRQLQSAKTFRRDIVTQITPLPAFYPAESYHQDYLKLHPMEPYIVFNDLPKVASLKSTFPRLYKVDFSKP